MGPPRPRRSAALGRGVAFGAPWRRGQDAAVAADAEAVRPGAGCAADPSSAGARSVTQDRLGLGRSRIGVLHLARHSLDAANVGRSFRAVVRAGVLDSETWTPREVRHSFVSLLSSSEMPIEDIAIWSGTPPRDDGAGLPQGAAPGVDEGCPGHGRYLRGPGPLALAVRAEQGRSGRSPVTPDTEVVTGYPH